MCTSKKPIETSPVNPELCMNSLNNFDMFLTRDPSKKNVFRGFKKMNRDLTQAYLRQSDKLQSENPKKVQDAETVSKVSSIFNKMQRPKIGKTPISQTRMVRFSKQRSSEQAGSR